MGNPFGRSVVLPLTNKSGGGVVAGDVVIIDSSNNDAFTTTTSGAYTGSIGVAQATIANDAVGLVLISGYAALVNVNASVTRGHFGKTHTVVKQATDAGTGRVAGTFCIFLTGGTTPDAFVWQPDLGGGSGLTDPMTTRGDIIVRNASNVTDRLGRGSANTVLQSDGTDVSWVAKAITPAVPQQISRLNGSNYTTNSTSFTDIDATNLKITQVFTASHYCLVTFNGMVSISATGAAVAIGVHDGTSDFYVCGSRLDTANNVAQGIAGSRILGPYAAGSQVFKLRFRVAGAATMTLYSTNSPQETNNFGLVEFPF